MENFDKNIHIKNNSNYNNDKLKESVQTHKDRGLEIERNSSVPIEEILGPGSYEKSLLVIDLVKKKFEERHIDIPEILPIFYKKESQSEKKIMGSSNGFYINIFNIEIEDMLLKQMIIFRILAHEMYHSFSRISFDVRDDENSNAIEKIRVDLKAVGASFVPKNTINVTEHLKLFEEGAAVHFEIDVFKDIQKMFPEETIKEYENVIEKTKIVIKNSGGNYGYLTIIRSHEGEDYIVHSNQEYFNSMQIVANLEKIIPDFLTLLEQARVYGKVIPLARAIDGKLGEGWYKKIATATTAQAETILAYLEKIKHIE